MRRKHPAAALVVITFALVLIAVAPGLAQTGVYGEIGGKVIDSSGGALPGVTVTITGSNQMGAKTATTGADGTYRFPALATGEDYKVQFELPGFGNVVRNGISVGVRVTARLDVTMQLASISESVTVTADSSVIDTANARAGTSLRNDLLQELPSAKDSSAILTMVAGVGRQNLNVGGSTTDLTNNVISNGTTQRQININGAETKAGSGDGRYNNYDAYEEINVELGAAGADTRRPGGGVSAELVAKSGGNQFHGMAQLFWYNHSLVGDNVNDKLRAQGILHSSDVVRLHQNTGQMGGPLVKDRLWWFASFHDFRVFRTVIGQTRLQEGRLTPYLGNVTYQMTSNQKVTLFYSAVPKVQKARAMSKFVDFLASEDQEAKGTTRQAKWLGTFGSKTVAEAGFFTFKYWWPSNPQYAAINATPGAGAPYNDTALGTFYNGFNGANNIRNNHRSEVNWAVTRFLPNFMGASNDIKVGTDFYYMYFRQDNFRGLGPDQEVSYQVANGVPTFVTLYSGPGRALRGQVSNSAFVQERFQIGRLTLNSGIRFDRYRGFLPEQSTEPGTRWESLFPAQIYPEQKNFTVWNDFSPRFNGVIKLTQDGKQIIKASIGKYPGEYDPIADSDFGNGNSLRSRRYVWLGDLNHNGLLDLNELGALRSTTAPGTSTVQAGYRNPTTNEAGIGYDRELGGGLALKTQYFYTWYVRGSTDTNIAIPRSAYSPVPYLDPGPDGIAGTADDKQITVYNIVDPAVATLSTIQRQTIPGTWKRSHAFNVSVQKRIANGFQIMTSYSRNHIRQNGNLNPNDPNAQINSNNVISPFEAPNSFKLLGSKTLPYGLQVSANYQYQNGLPYNRVLNVTGLTQGQFTIVADPPGTWRYDNVSELDVRFEKNLKLAKGQTMGFMLEGYNLFNASASTDSDGPGIGTVTGGNFGIISKIMPPRSWRLGYRYTF